MSLIKMSLFMVGGEGLIEKGTKSLSLLFIFFRLSLREGFKKFHTRGEGVSKGHFPYPIFFIFSLQMVYKSFLDIEVFFMYMGGSPLGAPQAPPRLHRS